MTEVARVDARKKMPATMGGRITVSEITAWAVSLASLTVGTLASDSRWPCPCNFKNPEKTQAALKHWRRRWTEDAVPTEDIVDEHGIWVDPVSLRSGYASRSCQRPGCR